MLLAPNLVFVQNSITAKDLIAIGPIRLLFILPSAAVISDHAVDFDASNVLEERPNRPWRNHEGVG